MFKGIIFVFLSLAVSVAHGSSCDLYLAEQPSGKSLERFNSLHPTEDKKTLSVRETTLLLAEEIWHRLPHGQIPWKDKPQLEDHLKKHLLEKFNSQFRIDEMNEDELYLFYVNQLRSIYFLSVREWMIGLIEHLPELNKEEQRQALIILTNQLNTSSLLRHTLSPDRVEEILDTPTLSQALKEALKSPPLGASLYNPCCMTEGCTLCPNNRAWLRKKSE